MRKQGYASVGVAESYKRSADIGDVLFDSRIPDLNTPAKKIVFAAVRF